MKFTQVRLGNSLIHISLTPHVEGSNYHTGWYKSPYSVLIFTFSSHTEYVKRESIVIA